MPPKDRAALEREAFAAAWTVVSVFKRGQRSRAKAIAQTEAESFSRTIDVANDVISQHRSAVVDDEWKSLAGHDRATVICELDAEFAAVGRGWTCVDAGWDDETSRHYVTIVADYPGLHLVGDRGPGVSSSGRPMLRRRTRAQRNALYLSWLASYVLAAVRLAISVAVASDDVHLVVMRRSDGAEDLEPIYVGTVSREAVTLRPALADPVPLLLGSAVRPMQFDGSAHDLVAVEPDAEVAEIVRLCAEALAERGDDDIHDHDSQNHGRVETAVL